MNTNINEMIETLDVAQEREVFIPSSSGDLKRANDYKAIWNMNTNTLGCIASKKYNIIQHKDVVKSIFTALDNLNIQYVKELKVDGHRIFLDIKFPDAKLLVKEQGEEFIGGLRLINSYDKTTGLLILPRLDRLACLNGMIVSKFLPGYSIRHNQKMVENFQGIIEKSLNEMINSCDIFKALINNCLADSVEWEIAEIVLLNLLRRKKHTELILQRLEGNGKNSKVTRWDIYNAITSYATHGEQLKPNVESWLQNKAQLLLQTQLSNLSDKNILQVVV